MPGRTLVLPLALALLAPSIAAAGDDAAALSLEQLGLRLEEARSMTAVEARPALDGILQTLTDKSIGKLPEERRAGARFLFAETLLSAGEYRRAADEFAKAEKASSKGTPFAEDAAFGVIRAREAAGDDAGAAKEWERWLEKNPTSPLRPEALLAAAWNATRRDSLRTAGAFLNRLSEEAPWTKTDSRSRYANAIVAYLDGRPVEALAALGDQTPGANAEYLRGLALRAKGDMLPAAARFQAVAQKWPDSSLRDVALLAKADVFLASKAWKSAAEEFGRVAEAAQREDIRAEAQMRQAAAVFLSGNNEQGIEMLHGVASTYPKTEVGARAQYLLGEGMFSLGRYEEAIVEFNRVLTNHFDGDLAARAQYRVGRSLDELNRSTEATSAYQAVVSGYSQSPESPAAAYLAGVGLLETGRPLAAAPYFRIVLDRYAQEKEGALVFAKPEHFELVEAALCLLELSYHRSGDLGQLSGVPHLMLGKMPSSKSSWRAWALMIDADALASLGRYEEAQTVLAKLLKEFPTNSVAIPANRLLAWTYAKTGRDDLAISTEEKMLQRYSAKGDVESLGSAVLHKAHILFNEKKYAKAAVAYDDFIRRFPDDKNILLALYQSGLSHLRVNHNGDAIDRWEEIAKRDPAGEYGAKAWARAGDLYFRAERYEDAKRCFRGLLEHAQKGETPARATLRLAQCEFNAGHDAEALRLYSEVVERFPDTGPAKEAVRGIEQALYRLGQSKNGAAVLADLVEKFPSSSFAADAQFQIALRAYEAKEWSAAADGFRRVVTQFPSFSAADRAHYLMAESLERAGSNEESLAAYEQFLSFFAASELRPSVQFRVASLRFATGDYAQAAVDFTGVLESKVSDETARAARYNLGLCQIQLGMIEEARATLEQFRKEQPTGDSRVADVAYRLGELHERAGQHKEAIAEYDKALASSPGTQLAVELHYRIGTCREGLSEQDAALAAYRRAVAAGNRSNAYHVMSLARLAALYEGRERYKDAVAAYQELIRDSKDAELVAAAKERVKELRAFTR
jgi:TolA-binding protein